MIAGAVFFGLFIGLLALSFALARRGFQNLSGGARYRRHGQGGNGASSSANDVYTPLLFHSSGSEAASAHAHASHDSGSHAHSGHDCSCDASSSCGDSGGSCDSGGGGCDGGSGGGD